MSVAENPFIGPDRLPEHREKDLLASRIWEALDLSMATMEPEVALMAGAEKAEWGHMMSAHAVVVMRAFVAFHMKQVPEGEAEMFWPLLMQSLIAGIELSSDGKVTVSGPGFSDGEEELPGTPPSKH